MSNGDSDTEKRENLRTVYSELCVSYRAIDDFRTKLLGFLPLATGAGLFLLVSDKDKMDFARQFFRPMGFFGFIITLGLFSYELYGIKKCGRLIRVGKLLENKKLHLDAQFEWRPRAVAGLINEPFAAGIIYPVVSAAWMFLALVSTWPRKDEPLYDSQRALFWAVVVFIVGFVLSILFNLWLKVEGKLEDKNLKNYSISEVMGEVPIVGRWTRAAGAPLATCFVQRRWFDARRRVNSTVGQLQFASSARSSETTMTSEYRTLFNVSTAQETLNRARKLLGLAKDNPDNAETLAACVVLLLAAGLEQATRSVLTFFAEKNALEENIQISETRYYALSNESLRTRTISLPSVLTRDRFCIVRQSPDIKHLHDLISARNRLLHINELPRLVEPEQVEPVEGGVLASYWLPLSENSWKSVSLVDAESFVEAVNIYFSEVVFPKSGEIGPGRIVVPAS